MAEILVSSVKHYFEKMKFLRNDMVFPQKFQKNEYISVYIIHFFLVLHSINTELKAREIYMFDNFVNYFIADMNDNAMSSRTSNELNDVIIGKINNSHPFVSEIISKYLNSFHAIDPTKLDPIEGSYDDLYEKYVKNYFKNIFSYVYFNSKNNDLVLRDLCTELNDHGIRIDYNSSNFYDLYFGISDKPTNVFYVIVKLIRDKYLPIYANKTPNNTFIY
jgi:hypothetical protein